MKFEDLKEELSDVIELTWLDRCACEVAIETLTELVDDGVPTDYKKFAIIGYGVIAILKSMAKNLDEANEVLRRWESEG